MQQWYQCPNCGAPVAFGVGFCGNCGAQLNWLTQQTQPPPPYPEQQRQGDYRYGQQIPKPRKTNPLLIGGVALIVIVLLVVGGVFAFDRFSQDTPSNNPPPTQETPGATPPSEPAPTTVQVPLDYEVVDVYVEEDSVTETRTLIIGNEEQTEQIVIPLFVACVIVKNADTVAGTFYINFVVEEPLDSFFLNKALNLAPGESQTAKCPAYTLGEWSHKITPSTKTVVQ
ncbi:zinc ribbon domain-containing protein [Chloroflexota bacterium]